MDLEKGIVEVTMDTDLVKVSRVKANRVEYSELISTGCGSYVHTTQALRN